MSCRCQAVLYTVLLHIDLVLMNRWLHTRTFKTQTVKPQTIESGIKRKSNIQLRSLKHCTLDTYGVRVLFVYLLRGLDYAPLCRYWFGTLLLFSTRLRSLL